MSHSFQTCLVQNNLLKTYLISSLCCHANVVDQCYFLEHVSLCHMHVVLAATHVITSAQKSCSCANHLCTGLRRPSPGIWALPGVCFLGRAASAARLARDPDPGLPASDPAQGRLAPGPGQHAQPAQPATAA